MTDRSTEIVAATCRVIARLGMHDFRVEDVAEEAGVSSALIYYYFGTRDALIRQAFDFAEGRSSAHASVDGISGAESVRRALLDEIDDSAASRENWVIWGETASAAVFDEDLRVSLAKWAEDWVGSIATLIRAGQTDGSIDSALDAHEAAEFLTSVVDQMGWRWLIGGITLKRAHQVIAKSINLALSATPLTA
jgi:AcrR family transcriptional regulator